jgi:hypothetical protein
MSTDRIWLFRFNDFCELYNSDVKIFCIDQKGNLYGDEVLLHVHVEHTTYIIDKRHADLENHWVVAEQV